MNDSRSPIATWLAGAAPLPPLEHVRAAKLGGYAYTLLPDHDPVRSTLRSDFLAALSRHHEIVRELRPLLAAWHDAGIEVLLFKGFYMAHVVYPVPGARFHGDVDVAVPWGQEDDAARIAAECGWTELGNSAAAGRPYQHYAFGLRRSGGAAYVDVHRHLLHSRLPWPRVQPRVTRAVWERAQTADVDGVPCRVPDPVDALLILALQRCWGDGWAMKPSDPIDVRHLEERFGVRRTDVLTRAGSLGCERSVRIFLERCDPRSGVIDLQRPTRAMLRQWHRAALRERPLLAVERPLRYLLSAPGGLLDSLRALPLVLRTRLLMRRHRDVRALLAAALSVRAPAVRGPAEERRRLVRGVRWCIRLLRLDPEGSCLLRSLAISRGLRARGWPVEFVSGVARDADGSMRGHAWVELDGDVLPELNEPGNRGTFRITLRAPQHTAGATH